MSNQKQHWDKLHDNDDLDLYSDKPTHFAEEVIKVIPPVSKILELGCGAGNDSLGFASAGHIVTATDFSVVAVQKNSDRYKNTPHLTFKVVNTGEKMDFHDNEFDVVYARLSVQYFTHQKTQNVFQEIHRVLKNNGFFCFLCRSPKDPLYGQGTEIEKDMFDNGGHIRHFFSEEYARSLLEKNFRIDKITEVKGDLYGHNSAFVQVVAKAIK